jgi:hypothetical protein
VNEASWTLDPVTQVELFVPSWSTPDQAIARAALKRAGRLRVIRFTNDWTHPWPLWEPGAERYNLRPEDLGLTAALAAALHDWHGRWELGESPATARSSDEAGSTWEAEGEALAEAVQEHVWDFADVVIVDGSTTYIWAERPRSDET